MNELLRRLRLLWRRAEFERELDEEMRHHLSLSAEASGSRKFGNITLLKEESRAMWTFTFWEQLAQDVRYGLRAMSGNKLFTAMAVLSLALGIGANTAIYSFMDAIMLRALPVAHPESLVTLSWRTNGNESHGLNFHDDSFLGSKEGFGGSVLSYPALELFARNDAIFS